MPLPYERPTGRYMRELDRVGSDALTFAQRVREANNFLGSFPEADALDLSARLEELKNGTAEGGRPVLELAAQQLTAWRYDHILHPDDSDPDAQPDPEFPPTLERGGDLDIALGQLITQVNTALQSYWREAGGEQPNLSENVTALPEGADIGQAEALESLDGAACEANRLQQMLQSDHDNPSPELETPGRILVDLQNQAVAGKIEVRQPRPREQMLTRIGQAMNSTFKALEEAEGPLQVVGTVMLGAGLASGSITLTSLGGFVVSAGKSLAYVARKVRERREAASARLTPQAAGPYDPAIALEMIMNGQAPPAAWIPSIVHVDLTAQVDFEDLSPLKNLTALQHLDLSFTSVSDLTALKEIKSLRFLNLTVTSVNDLTPLQGHRELRRLILWGLSISDISFIRDLRKLRHLDLGSTRTDDISALKELDDIEYLELSGTTVTDLTPLKDLQKLEYLGLYNTPVRDVTALKHLMGLKRLNLERTWVLDASSLQPLTLGGLKIIGFNRGRLVKARRLGPVFPQPKIP